MEGKIAFALSLLVLIVTGVLGIYNGNSEWNGSTTGWQKSVSALIAAGIIWAAELRSPARQPG